MLLLVLSPKLLNDHHVSVLKSLRWLKIYQKLQYKIFLSHTKHFILVIHLIFGHSYISSTLGQLAHLLLSHLVALLISHVSISLVDLSTILLLLYGTHFLLIFVSFLTIILQPHLSLLYLLLFSTKNSKPTCFIGLFLLKTPLTTWTDISGTDLAMDSSLSTFTFC